MALGKLTLLQIRTAAQQRSNMENSGFITTAEWNSNINQSLYELYDLLVQKYGNDYFVATPSSITTDGTNSLYALPSDFYKLLGVDLSLGSTTNSWVNIKPFNFADRNRYAFPNSQNFYGNTNLQYRLNGSNILFSPLPAAGQSIRLWYVPRLTELSSDSDIAEGVDGWLEYVIVDAAIKALTKEESSTTDLDRTKLMLIKRIEAAAENRDAGSPQTVSDTRNDGGGFSGW